MPVQDWNRLLAEYLAARKAFEAAADALAAQVAAGKAPTAAQLLKEERTRAALFRTRVALRATGYTI